MNEPRRPAAIPHLRWYIAVLLCFASELNYLDRQTLSVLAQTIQRELSINDVEYSYITSSFLISYTVMYAVSGRIIDRIGTRRSFMIFVSAWSLANMVHGFANSARQFAAARFLLGAAEPANFPAGVRAVSEWFPVKERALAIGIFNAGTALGSAVAVPTVSFIALTFGWRSAFVVTGALGFVWVAVWAMFYRLPADHPRLGDEERALILGDEASRRSSESGSDAVAAGATPAVRAADTQPVAISKLLSLRATWGCIAARALTDPISFFLTFWIPKYLQQERGFTLADVGAYAWIPFVALAVGNVAGGAIPRALIAKGWTVNRARKTTMLVTSLVMPVCYFLLPTVDSATMALFLLTIAMFGHAAWGNITLPAEVFPTRAIGTVTGLGGAFGGLAGVLTQLAIGRTVQAESFTPIFVTCGVIYLVAFALVSWLVGELGKIIDVDAPEPAR
jgi:ACS family hexuronate transporter-like MFS transporter